MITYILIAVAVVVVLFVLIVSARPSQFAVVRSTTVNASPDAPFAQINNLHNWQAWSPWAKMDPNAKINYSGPDEGTGSGYSWEGNSKVGAGRMTIVESRANELVRFKLEFLKPMRATSEAKFTFKDEGGRTLVTWAITGKNNFVGKAFSLFMNCDKMIGGQFEQGLAAMKAIAEQKTLVGK